MRTFDEEAFRSGRRFAEHNQWLPHEDLYGDGTRNRKSLYEKYENLTVSFDESGFTGRYAWVDAIDDPALALGLKRLSHDDLELLTLYTIEGYSQPEIARLLKRDQSVISRKLARIKNI